MKLFIITVMVFLGTVIYGQCGQSDLNKLMIKGNVSQIKTTGFDIKNGVKEIDYIRISRYSAYGDELGYTFAHQTEKLRPTKITFEFDENKNKIKENRYDVKGELECTLVYKYDSLGNCLEEIYYLNSDNFDSFSLFTYDSNCNLTSYSDFMADSTLWFSYVYDYDENGYLIERRDVNEVSVTTYFNDEFGRPTSSETYGYEDNLLGSNTYFYKFDKKGNLSEVVILNENDEEESRYVYINDKKGNWIQKTSYTNGVITWIDTREFTYMK